jgi:hypothetical protein
MSGEVPPLYGPAYDTEAVAEMDRARTVNEVLEWVGEWLAADTPLSTEEIARCVATGRAALLGGWVACRSRS